MRCSIVGASESELKLHFQIALKGKKMKITSKQNSTFALSNKLLKVVRNTGGHHDIQHNDTQHEDTQHEQFICDTQHK